MKRVAAVALLVLAGCASEEQKAPQHETVISYRRPEPQVFAPYDETRITIREDWARRNDPLLWEEILNAKAREAHFASTDLYVKSMRERGVWWAEPYVAPSAKTASVVTPQFRTNFDSIIPSLRLPPYR